MIQSGVASPLGDGAMTSDEYNRMTVLCMKIRDEKNPETFDALIEELNALLEQKSERIQIERVSN
jgi:hypothetical protein